MNGAGSLADVTVLVPTRNRPRFLARLLGHLEGMAGVRALVVDSSDPGPAAEVAGIVAARAGGVELLALSRPTTQFAALALGAEKVTTPYVLRCSDDDLPVAAGLTAARDELAAAPDLGVAMGGFLCFDLAGEHGTPGELYRRGEAGSRRSQRWRGPPRSRWARLLDHAGWTPAAALLRSDLLARAAAVLRARRLEGIVAEIYLSLAAVAGAGVALVPFPFYLMQQHPAQVSVLDASYRRTLDWMSDPAWGTDLIALRAALAEELPGAPEEAAATCDDALQAVLAEVLRWRARRLLDEAPPRLSWRQLAAWARPWAARSPGAGGTPRSTPPRERSVTPRWMTSPRGSGPAGDVLAGDRRRRVRPPRVLAAAPRFARRRQL